MPATPPDACALAHRAAHDLRGPLRRIEAFAEIVREDGADALDGRRLQALGIASRSAREAAGLVDRLLELALASCRPLERTDADVRASVETALGSLADRIGATGATVRLGEPGTVDADPELLTLLCAELLANAIAFREPDRAPDVRLDMDYTDGGRRRACGFATTASACVALGPFEAAPDADGLTGAGLGLALCRAIRERHGWSLALGDGGATTEVIVKMGLTRRRRDGSAKSGNTD